MNKINNDTFQFNRKETLCMCKFLGLMGINLPEKCSCEDMKEQIENMLEESIDGKISTDKR